MITCKILMIIGSIGYLIFAPMLAFIPKRFDFYKLMLIPLFFLSLVFVAISFAAAFSVSAVLAQLFSLIFLITIIIKGLT